MPGRVHHLLIPDHQETGPLLSGRPFLLLTDRAVGTSGWFDSTETTKQEPTSGGHPFPGVPHPPARPPVYRSSGGERDQSPGGSSRRTLTQCSTKALFPLSRAERGRRFCSPSRSSSSRSGDMVPGSPEYLPDLQEAPAAAAAAAAAALSGEFKMRLVMSFNRQAPAPGTPPPRGPS